MNCMMMMMMMMMASMMQMDASTITDPDCLGPCEPGTSVILEGLVWAESNNGMYTHTIAELTSVTV